MPRDCVYTNSIRMIHDTCDQVRVQSLEFTTLQWLRNLFMLVTSVPTLHKETVVVKPHAYSLNTVLEWKSVCQCGGVMTAIATAAMHHLPTFFGIFLTCSLNKILHRLCAVLPYSGKIWRALNLAKRRKKAVF